MFGITATTLHDMPATLPKDAATRSINLRLPLAVYQQLDILAKATDRSRDLVTLEAISTDLEAQTGHIKEIEAGIAEADSGDFATAAEVSAVLAKYGA